MSASSNDETEFRQEDLELAAANSLSSSGRRTRAGGASSSKEATEGFLGDSKTAKKIAAPLDVSTSHESGEKATSSGVSSSSSEKRNAASMDASTSSGGQTATSREPSTIPNVPEHVDPYAETIKLKATFFFKKC